MPATVAAVHVKPGQQVARGDVLITLEAMKMELAIKAPRDGRVRTIACRAGDLVQPGVPLVEIELRKPRVGSEATEAGEGGSGGRRGYFTQSSQRTEFLSGGGSPAHGRHMDREEARRRMAPAAPATRLRASSRSMPRVARPTASLTSDVVGPLPLPSVDSA